MRVLKQTGSTVMDLTKIRSLKDILSESKKKSEKAMKKARLDRASGENIKKS